jgi:hypothetical protein
MAIAAMTLCGGLPRHGPNRATLHGGA